LESSVKSMSRHEGGGFSRKIMERCKTLRRKSPSALDPSEFYKTEVEGKKRKNPTSRQAVKIWRRGETGISDLDKGDCKKMTVR